MNVSTFVSSHLPLTGDWKELEVSHRPVGDCRRPLVETGHFDPDREVKGA